MCGLIGIIPNNYISKDMVDIFKQSLYIGALRGWDGTGMFKVDHKDNVEVHKTASVPGVLLHKLEKESLWGKVLIGHNRAATKGVKTDANTHPFTEGAITLVHNGTIFNHLELAKTDVDSHAICHALNDKSVEELIKSIDGAYALIWYDKRDTSINILRNNDRPLFALKSKDFWYLCSEKEMGEWVLTRNNIKQYQVEQIKPFVHYKLSLNSKETKKWIKISYKHLEEEIKNKFKKPIHIYNQSQHNNKSNEVDDSDLWYGFFLDRLKTHYNISKGDCIDVVFNKKTYGQTGVSCYQGYLFADKDFKVKLYSSKTLDLSSKSVEVEFVTLVQEKDEFILFCSTKKDTVNKDEHGQEFGFKCKTDVYVTEAINGQLIGEKCLQCNRDYIAHKDMELHPVTINGLTLRYRYYCHSCCKDTKAA